MSGPEPRVEVHEDTQALAVGGGWRAAGPARRRPGGRAAYPTSRLTGGSVADAVHRGWPGSPTRARSAGGRLVAGWCSGGATSASSSRRPRDRNERQARESFLDQVGVDPALVHPMPSTESADSAEAGAAAYGDALRAHGSGQFEVVMLGVGPDAHVASLFPGYPQLDVDDIAVAVHDSPKPPPDRISLTLPCLNRTQVGLVRRQRRGQGRRRRPARSPRAPDGPRRARGRSGRPGRDDLVPRPGCCVPSLALTRHFVSPSRADP